MSQQAKIVAILTAHPGKAEDLQALLVNLAPHCRAEPGNLRWDIWQDPSAGRFVLDELYRDGNALAAHRETVHYQDYLSKIGDLAERSAFILDPADVVENPQAALEER